MRWPLLPLAIVILSLGVPQALGGRCLDVPEGQILWCDDFDNYCEGGAAWPGYPPFPAGCPTDGSAVADNDAFYSNWILSFDCLNSGYLENQSVTAELSPGSVTPPPRQLAYNLPFTMKFAGAGYGDEHEPTNWMVPTRHVFPLTAAIHTKDASKNAVNGTDANPLKLKYYLNHYTKHDCTNCGRDIGNSIWYTELTFDDDRAPTDYIWRNCQPGGTYAVYPIVCQQNYTVPGCPGLSDTIHASIAVGMLALLDTNPCDLENGRLPTNYHLSAFDGKQWWTMNGGLLEDQVGAFSVCTGGPAWVYMEVRTEKLFITFDNTCAGEPAHNEGKIYRRYKGPFNKIASGPGPGCELSSSTHTCISSEDCFKYCSGSDLNPNGVAKQPDWCWKNTYWDTPVLYDGVLVTAANPTGACCNEDGVCNVTFEDECTGYGKRWAGADTTCDDPGYHCFQYPFADNDLDDDVDQVDFAAFQLCYTGAGGGVPPGCESWDRDDAGAGDDDIDAADFAEFNKCWTGPNVKYSDVVQPLVDPCNP